MEKDEIKKKKDDASNSKSSSETKKESVKKNNGDKDANVNSEETSDLKSQYEKLSQENDDLSNINQKQAEEIKELIEKVAKLEKEAAPKKELKEKVPEFGKTPSFGQKMVGINFNPSGLDEVGFSKNIFANAIDQIHDIRKVGTSPTQNGLCEQAVQACVVAQMLAVKAITWKD